MKQTVIGLMIGAGLVALATGATPQPSAVYAQRAPHAGGARDDLIALTTPLADGGQRLVLIDSRQRVVAVYHIDGASGQLALVSVRNIHWDLRMTQFNGTSPLPEEIRSLLEQK